MEYTGGKLCEEGLDDMVKHDEASVPNQSYVQILGILHQGFAFPSPAIKAFSS